MSWLTNVARPKIKALFSKKRETPDNLWRKCDACGEMIFHRDLTANQLVCPSCDHHMRIGPQQRFDALFDEVPETVVLPGVPTDPLKFRDVKRYPDRLKEYRAKTGQQDAFAVAAGAIGGFPAVIAVQNFAFMGGSLGMAAGEAMLEAARQAVQRRAALIAIPGSGGARMQEGILSLMQLPRTTIAVEMVREAGLPYIVVLTDPTTGGVTASFAMLGDVQISEPGALIGFAGARVIRNTIRQNLPEGFQRAEYLLEHGMLDMVVHRHKLRETLSRLLSLLMMPGPRLEPRPDSRDEAESDRYSLVPTAE
jgi:acetyl-CoA carboxylase carboxyl transferase subunit beta